MFVKLQLFIASQTQKTLNFTANDVEFPQTPGAMTSFLIKKKVYLWDQNNVR